MIAGRLRLAMQLRDFMLRRLRPALGPFRLWVDITSRCNLKCPACPQRLLSPDDRRDMPEELLDLLAWQVFDFKIPEVNLFHRGEPLLHPRFGYWARRFREAGALVRVCTATPPCWTRPEVEGAIWRPRPNFFTCSVDSLDPAAYAATPGRGLTWN
jgi:MoaA/NifB/PqqE/SkfB family radical SAM enzyme